MSLKITQETYDPVSEEWRTVYESEPVDVPDIADIGVTIDPVVDAQLNDTKERTRWTVTNDRGEDLYTREETIDANDDTDVTIGIARALRAAANRIG